MLAVDGFDDQLERGVMQCVQRLGGRQPVLHELRPESLATMGGADGAGRLHPVDDLGRRLVVDRREAEHRRAVEHRQSGCREVVDR